MAFISFNKWISALTKPAATFKKEKSSANLMEGAKHIGVAGLVIGLINGIVIAVGLPAVSSLFGASSMGAALGIVGFVASLIGTPIMMLVSWLLGSGVLYVLAKLLGGNGNFTTQSYLMALYLAPIMLLTSILGMIPLIGAIISTLVMLYSLYLLTLALKEAHGFSTMRAVLTWLILLVIVVILATMMGLAAALAILGLSNLV